MVKRAACAAGDACFAISCGLHNQNMKLTTPFRVNCPLNLDFFISMFSHGARTKPFGRGGNNKIRQKSAFPPSPYGFLLALLIHVALSCAASCGAFGATVRTSCSHPLPFPPCQFFTASKVSENRFYHIDFIGRAERLSFFFRDFRAKATAELFG